jgi:hypothetical protein
MIVLHALLTEEVSATVDQQYHISSNFTTYRVALSSNKKNLRSKGEGNFLTFRLPAAIDLPPFQTSLQASVVECLLDLIYAPSCAYGIEGRRHVL